MGLAGRPAVLAVDITNVTISGGLTYATEDAVGVYRLSFQPVFSGYQSVTVKVQATLDGTNYADVSNMTTSTSAAIVSGEIGPYQTTRLHVTGTVSGTSVLKVYKARSLVR